jgi:hypothetical protein
MKKDEPTPVREALTDLTQMLRHVALVVRRISPGALSDELLAAIENRSRRIEERLAAK